MSARRRLPILRAFLASVLLAIGLVLGLGYGWLFFQYKKITVSASDIAISAKQGNLELAFELRGNNPLPFSIAVKKYEGKATYGVLSRNFEINFDPELLITSGEYTVKRDRDSLTPGYPVNAEETFLKMLRGKDLAVVGEATIYVGKITTVVPVSLTLSVEE
jgi:hypothetical protein